MPLPVVLELFGCGVSGCQKPVEDVPAVFPRYDPNYTFFKNAMPLIPATTIDGYEAAAAKFGMITISTDQRNHSDPNAGALQFDKYSFELKSAAEELVYPITSCYLHWLHDGKTDPNLLGGAVTQAGESILVLKPLPASEWVYWHPGKIPVLTECAYLNVELDEGMMKTLIQRTTTEKYHQKVYKHVTDTDIASKPDWYLDYFALFKEHPEVPIVVNPLDYIGKTTGQDFSLYFKMGEQWTDHMDEVENFFRYYRRYHFLIGHPLISTILAHNSVRSQTVDLIRRETDKNGAPLWLRSKESLLLDFYPLALSADPEYHPLTLNTEEHPHRVIVPRSPVDGALPIQNLVIRNDHFLTRLRVSNPLGLPIEIDGFDEAHIRISPVNFSAEEQIIELSAAENIPPGILETPMRISTDGDLICDLNLTFFEFRTFSVKFHRLTDYDNLGNSIHQADMDEAKLRDALIYANEIIGRQSNTWLVPVPTAEGGILHELPYNGNLGDMINESNSDLVTKQVFEQVSGSENKKANIIFVWNKQNSQNNLRGVTMPTITYEDTDNPSTKMIAYAAIMINTKAPNIPMGIKEYGQTIVHELGHWLSFVFEYFGNVENSLPLCNGIVTDFTHEPNGCAGGDWALYSNLMMNGGGYFISQNQAIAFNSNAIQVLP
jgi:hypothetical protein